MKYILDVDTGIDDVLAITYLLGSKVEVLGLTTVFGNNLLKHTTKNTLDLLNLLDHNEIPVYKGESCPIDKDTYVLRHPDGGVHGQNGIGNVELVASSKDVEEISAADFIAKSAEKYGEELTCIFVGPLTNLAKAIEKNKEAMKLVHIYIMGGALTIEGNVTKYAEANIYADPLAAKYVFDSEVGLNIIGLDVTHQTLITSNDLHEIAKINNEKSNKLLQIADYYFQREFSNGKGGALHDPLAVEAALNPNIITNWFKTNLTVVTEGEAIGRTIGNMACLEKKEKHVNYALEVDSNSFIKKFVETIKEEVK